MDYSQQTYTNITIFASSKVSLPVRFTIYDCHHRLAIAPRFLCPQLVKSSDTIATMAAHARDLKDPRIVAMLQPAEQADQPDPSLSRTCFVTIGATAGFRPLLDEIASGRFRSKLQDLGYTKLVVQCGPDVDYFQAAVAQSESNCSLATTSSKLSIESFAYTDDIGSMMRLAGPSSGHDDGVQRGYGVIVSHAGKCA